MLASMVCWGSWANTLKMCPGYRFQLFYWDYVIGLLAGTLLWGLTLGTFGSSSTPFLSDVLHAASSTILLALLSGMLFNVANLLLVAAIDIAGLAVAFPIGIGLALVVGAVSSYLLAPAGNPALLFLGIALVIAAIIFDAAAYRLRDSRKKSLTLRGVMLSLAAGLLMGTFYPFISRAMAGPQPLGPYAAAFFFALGVVACALPFNYLLMRRSLDGSVPISMEGYWRAASRWHLWGVLGGLVWCTGAVFNFVASRTHVVGPAISYSIGQGATMISAAWGVFIWKEFAAAPSAARRLLVWMFILFASGLTAIALAPVF